MRKKRDVRREPFEVRIDKLIYGGHGLGRFEGRVVFVPFAAPGDRLAVRATEEKKNYIRAAIVQVLEAGRQRTDPRCPHFGRCGGCHWQHIGYEHQAEAKRTILESLFHHRFPSTREIAVSFLTSPDDYAYRSRARIHLQGFGAGSRTGFRRFQSHTVEDIENCPLFRPVLNRALQELRRQRQEGASGSGICELDIACSEETGIWGASAVEPGTCEYLPVQLRPADAGEVVLHRRIGPFEYQWTPDVFFQANDLMLEPLARLVSDLMESKGKGQAMDLYCGVGLFTLPLAARYGEVVAVESSSHACDICRQNVAAAGFANVRVLSADVASWMKAVSSVTAPCYDLVVLDPPRAGAGREVVEQLGSWAPSHIIYVSCDPQTLCRDLEALLPSGYRIASIHGMDLFPQTYHFETIVHLERVA